MYCVCVKYQIIVIIGSYCN